MHTKILEKAIRRCSANKFFLIFCKNHKKRYILESLFDNDAGPVNKILEKRPCRRCFPVNCAKEHLFYRVPFLIEHLHAAGFSSSALVELFCSEMFCKNPPRKKHFDFLIFIILVNVFIYNEIKSKISFSFRSYYKKLMPYN